MDDSRIPEMKFHHVSLNVSNYEESLEFYQALGLKWYCDWVSDESGMRNCFLSLGSSPVLEIHECKEMSVDTGAQEHFCFIVERDADVQRICELVSEYGAEILAEPFNVTLNCRPSVLENARVLHIQGPSGEHIEFICWHGYVPGLHKTLDD